MGVNTKSKILVTGGKGFLGRVVSRKLKASGYENVIDLPGSRAPMSLDLTRHVDVAHLFNHHKPDIVVHLAARVGGIGANKENP